MILTIINDCRDDNARGRQLARVASIAGDAVSFVGVSSDLEAAGNLIDILDAYGDAPGALLVNVAPRGGRGKRWPNGTPFGYFWYKKILILSSVDGLTLSLVKKLKLVDHINVLDIPSVVKILNSSGLISGNEAEYISRSQFRSYDFLPIMAGYLLKHREIGGEKLQIEDIPDAPKAVWWVDNFGNCKTSLLKSDIDMSRAGLVSTKVGSLIYYDRLKDVPDGEMALITGSSGIGEDRFLEIVKQGGRAADRLGLASGDLIIP